MTIPTPDPPMEDWANAEGVAMAAARRMAPMMAIEATPRDSSLFAVICSPFG
jgi:hypothetical protein